MNFYIPNTVQVKAQLSSKMDDFSEIANLLEEKQNIENEIAERFADQLQQNAEQKLYLSKDRYIEAISVEGGEVNLDTSDFVVNMVENGASSFDMKPGLLSSPKVKTSKNGQKYMSVPVSTMKHGKYNWRDKQSGQFKSGTSGVKGIEFRIVSEKSPANSWVHPGHAGFHIMEQTLLSFDEQIDLILDAKIDVMLSKL